MTLNVYRQASNVRTSPPRLSESEWREMYYFWLDCHGKKDTLTNCLKFMALRHVSE